MSRTAEHRCDCRQCVWRGAVDDLGLAGRPLSPAEWSAVVRRAGFDPMQPVNRQSTVDVTADPGVVGAAKVLAQAEDETDQRRWEWLALCVEERDAEMVAAGSPDAVARSQARAALPGIRERQAAAQELMDDANRVAVRAREAHRRAALDARLRADPPTFAAVPAPDGPVRRPPGSVGLGAVG